jgi:DNA-binding transcriptional MerR regulator
MPLPTTPSPAASARAAPATLTTSALCAAAGVTRGMLRVYEREGLIEAPRRTPSGYRNFPAAEVLRLQAIRSLKEIGFTLKEIALLLDERDQGELDPQRLRELAPLTQAGTVPARGAALRRPVPRPQATPTPD